MICRVSLVIVMLLCYTHSSILSQKRPYNEILAELEGAEGDVRTHVLLALSNQDIYSDQELARSRAKEAYTISKRLNIQRGMGFGLRYIGLSYFFEGKLDSARVYYEKCAPYFETPKDKAWSYYNIATIFEKQSEYDSALYYLNIAEEFFAQDEALAELGAAAMLHGTINGFKGNYSDALPYFIKARDLFESANDLVRKADAITELGRANAELENYQLCIDYLKEASSIYESQNDPYYNSQVLNYIGFYLIELEQIDSAIVYLQKSLTLSKEVNHHFITGNALKDLARLDMADELFNAAREKIEESNTFYAINDEKHSIANNFKLLGELEMKLKRFQEAENAYLTGLSIAKEIGAQGILESIHKELKSVYVKKGKYKSAVYHFDEYVAIKDSISSADQIKNMQNLLVKYETEKKEKELVIAKAEIDRRAANIKLLSMGLVTLFILGLSIIYSIIQKRKKEKAELLKQNAEERQQRELIEKELEFKQKELVTKVLQLARKNEFLQKLESEVSALKSTVDNKINFSSDKIARMIQHDAYDDQEWLQFSKEFSSLHEDFLDRLKSNYGSFTTNEIRLISLMKMNLSSKDIANILRISAEGIKKARYRLRKKINLDSEVNLQSYILSF